MTIDRRDFVRLAAAVGALSQAAPIHPAAASGEADFSLAGHVTRLAAIDDCRTLALNAGDFSNALRRVLDEQHEVVRSGGMLPWGAERAQLLLRSGDDRKAALGLGWLIENAFGSLLAADGHDAVVQDAVIFRELFLAQPWADEAALREADPQDLEDLFLLLKPRTLTVLHTFTPDRDAIYDWVPRVAAWDERLVALLRAYAEAYAKAEPLPAFYDRNEPLIRLARRIEMGMAVDRKGWDKAVEAARTGSRYAQALERGYRAIEQADTVLLG